MNRQATASEGFNVHEDAPSHLTVYLDAIYDSRWLIFIIAASVLLIGTGYAFLSKPVYRADILVQLQESDPNPPKNVLKDLSSMFDVKTDAAGESEVLGSRFVVTQAVDKFHFFIDASPRYFPVVGHLIADRSDSLSTPGPWGYVWGEEHIEVSVFDLPPRFYGRAFILTKINETEYDIAYRDINIRGTIGQTLHATTPYGQVDLRVDRIEAEPGATFNVTRFSRTRTIEDVRNSLKITDKGKDSDVIKASLDGPDPVMTSEILNAVGNAYVQQNIQRKSEEAARAIAFLEFQLPELKKQMEAAEDRFNDFRASRGTINLSEEAAGLLRRTVHAQTRREELEQKRKDLLTLYTESHPAVRSIDAQLQTAQNELNKIAERARALPPLEQNLFRLQRDVQVNTELYTALLNTLEQLRLVKAGKVGNARLVDAAAVPERPIWPKRTPVILFSLLVGLFFGIAVALIRRQLFDAVNDPNEIEETIGLPVYASVPYSRQEARLARKNRSVPSHSVILANAAHTDPAIESLRGFRTALEFALHDAPNNIVLISGPTSGIGKSFIALNLAAVLGASGKRVLLVDADLYRGHLHSHIGVNRGPGFSDLIRGMREPNEVIRRNALDGVDFISAGTSVPNVSDLLSGQKLEAALKRLSAAYDIVLCDAPPVLPAPAAAQLANSAGTTFLVARQGVTGIGELREAVRKLERAGSSVRGVVVNSLQLRPGRCSYGYGRYRYAADTYELDPRMQD
ncbi:GNVR domain-containing protein [Caballeronia arvi]|nr:GNVR domain-containing protein [Caballeronia arvi]